jgi:hypothetical protein
VQVITDVVPEIFYNAQHPIAKLSDGNHAGFTVRTRVYLWSPSGLQGKLRVAGSWGAEASVSLDQKGGASVAVVNVSASAEQVTKRSCVLFWHVCAPFSDESLEHLPRQARVKRRT